MLTSLITLLVAAAMGIVYGYVQQRFLKAMANRFDTLIVTERHILSAELTTQLATLVGAVQHGTGHLEMKLEELEDGQKEAAKAISNAMATRNASSKAFIEKVTSTAALDRQAIGKEVKKIRRLLKQTPGQPGFRARTHRPETAEERIDEASKTVAKHWKTETVQEGIRQLRTFYEEEDMPIPSDADLKEEAEQLLNASVNGEVTI